jgi:hypothetical protein
LEWAAANLSSPSAATRPKKVEVKAPNRNAPPPRRAMTLRASIMTPQSVPKDGVEENSPPAPTPAPRNTVRKAATARKSRAKPAPVEPVEAARLVVCFAFIGLDGHLIASLLSMFLC